MSSPYLGWVLIQSRLILRSITAGSHGGDGAQRSHCCHRLRREVGQKAGGGRGRSALTARAEERIPGSRRRRWSRVSAPHQAAAVPFVTQLCRRLQWMLTTFMNRRTEGMLERRRKRRRTLSTTHRCRNGVEKRSELDIEDRNSTNRLQFPLMHKHAIQLRAEFIRKTMKTFTQCGGVEETSKLVGRVHLGVTFCLIDANLVFQISQTPVVCRALCILANLV